MRLPGFAYVEARTGRWIGYLERFLALASFWIPEHTIIGAWVAFKLAAKWEGWRNIVQFPDKLEGTTQLDYLRARSELGSYLITRLLVGTFANILIGLVAWYVGTNSFEIYYFFFNWFHS